MRDGVSIFPLIFLPWISTLLESIILTLLSNINISSMVFHPSVCLDLHPRFHPRTGSGRWQFSGAWSPQPQPYQGPLRGSCRRWLPAGPARAAHRFRGCRCSEPGGGTACGRDAPRPASPVPPLAWPAQRSQGLLTGSRVRHRDDIRVIFNQLNLDWEGLLESEISGTMQGKVN